MACRLVLTPPLALIFIAKGALHLAPVEYGVGWIVERMKRLRQILYFGHVIFDGLANYIRARAIESCGSSVERSNQFL